MADLTLYINQSGAWRRALTFDADRFEEVHAAIFPLALALMDDTAWKISDNAGAEQWHFDERQRGQQA